MPLLPLIKQKKTLECYVVYGHFKNNIWAHITREITITTLDTYWFWIFLKICVVYVKEERKKNVVKERVNMVH